MSAAPAPPSGVLAPYFHRLERGSTLRWQGRVLQVVGNLIESEGPFCSVGEACEIATAEGRRYPGEIVGFRGSTMLSMTLEPPQGIRFGDRIAACGTRPSIRVGAELLGRVVDATGSPIDGLGDYSATRTTLVEGGGEAFRVRNGEDFADAGRKIEALIAGETLAPPAVLHHELWPYPAAFAMAGAFAMVATKRRRR